MTADVWLPFRPDEIDGLPEGPDYHFWDGAEDFPANSQLWGRNDTGAIASKAAASARS